MPLFGKNFLTNNDSHHKSDLIKGAINTAVLIELLVKAMSDYESRLAPKKDRLLGKTEKIEVAKKGETLTASMQLGEFNKKVDLTPLNILIHHKISKVLLAQEKTIKKDAAAEVEASKSETVEKTSATPYKGPVNMVQQFIDDARGSKVRNLEEKERHSARTQGIQAFQEVDKEFRRFFKLGVSTSPRSSQTLFKAYKELIKTIDGMWERQITYPIIATNEGLKLKLKENGDFYFEGIERFSISKKLQDEIVEALIQNIPEILSSKENDSDKLKPPGIILKQKNDELNKKFVERIEQGIKQSENNPWGITDDETIKLFPLVKQFYDDYIRYYGVFPATKEVAETFFTGNHSVGKPWRSSDLGIDPAVNLVIKTAKQIHADCKAYAAPDDKNNINVSNSNSNTNPDNKKENDGKKEDQTSQESQNLEKAQLPEIKTLVSEEPQTTSDHDDKEKNVDVVPKENGISNEEMDQNELFRIARMNELFLERVQQGIDQKGIIWNITNPVFVNLFPYSQKMITDYIDTYKIFPSKENDADFKTFVNKNINKNMAWGDSLQDRQLAFANTQWMISDCEKYVNETFAAEQAEQMAQQQLLIQQKKNELFLEAIELGMQPNNINIWFEDNSPFLPVLKFTKEIFTDYIQTYGVVPESIEEVNTFFDDNENKTTVNWGETLDIRKQALTAAGIMFQGFKVNAEQWFIDEQTPPAESNEEQNTMEISDEEQEAIVENAEAQNSGVGERDEEKVENSSESKLELFMKHLVDTKERLIGAARQEYEADEEKLTIALASIPLAMDLLKEFLNAPSFGTIENKISYQAEELIQQLNSFINSDTLYQSQFSDPNLPTSAALIYRTAQEFYNAEQNAVKNDNTTAIPLGEDDQPSVQEEAHKISQEKGNYASYKGTGEQSFYSATNKNSNDEKPKVPVPNLYPFETQNFNV